MVKYFILLLYLLVPRLAKADDCTGSLHVYLKPKTTTTNSLDDMRNLLKGFVERGESFIVE